MFEKILKTFVEFDEPSANVQPQSTPVSTPIPPTYQSQHSVVDVAEGDGDLVVNFTEKLRVAIANSSDKDILNDFTITYDTLSETIKDAGTCFRSAVKIVTTQSKISENDLLAIFQKQMEIVDSEQAKFTSAVENQRVNNVQTRQAKIDEINMQLDVKNKEIEILRNERDTLSKEIIDEESKLATATASFEGAVRLVKTSITDTINKFRVYATTQVS
jgi:predicted  nucleic acid-binding Zn-ribbon protein